MTCHLFFHIALAKTLKQSFCTRTGTLGYIMRQTVSFFCQPLIEQFSHTQIDIGKRTAAIGSFCSGSEICTNISRDNTAWRADQQRFSKRCRSTRLQLCTACSFHSGSGKRKKSSQNSIARRGEHSHDLCLRAQDRYSALAYH